MAFSVLKENITVKNIILFIIFTAALVFMSKITNVLMLFFASYVIACSFNPVVDKFEKKMPRSLAVALLLFLVVVLLFVFFIPVVVLSVQQVQVMAQTFPAHIANLKTSLLSMNILGYSLSSLFDMSSMFENVSELASNFVNHSITATIGVAGALVNFFAFI